METSLPEQELSHCGQFVAQTIGLHFPPARWPDLRRGIAATAAELGFETSLECVRNLMSAEVTKCQLDVLASHLTVGETYFFRDLPNFEILSRSIIPELLRTRQNQTRRLRIWSAGCCTGDEPYSIAISLAQAIPDLHDWTVTLLATDINSRFLSKAEAGLFGSWSFRNSPPGLKDRYFRPTSDGRFEILPEIRRMVHFSQLNLVDDNFPSAGIDLNEMDVIFCRNVLMYFTPQQAKKAIGNLYRAQMDGGWLIVSPSESPNVLFPPYRTVNFDGVFLYQKGSSSTARVQPPSTAVAPIEQPVVPISHIDRRPPAKRPVRKPQRVNGAEEPNDPYLRAVALYREGNYEDAANMLGGLLCSRPNDPAALDLLARAFANQGKLSEALACCDRWIAADKLNPASHYLRSVVLQEQNAMDSAVQSLVKSLYLDPGYVMAHIALGNIAHANGHTREATRHMKNAKKSLERFKPSDVLRDSDGITAGRLAQIIGTLEDKEVAA